MLLETSKGNRMRWLAPLGGIGLVVVLAGGAQPSRAEGQVVVEFFTSQGCSTCPPADAIFSDLAKMPGVIALALHVDYWDYLGWKDPFGKPEHTDRQRGYARAQQERTIYTPQMIVQGQDIVKGHEEATILERIAAHGSEPAPVEVVLSRDAGGLEIALSLSEGAVGLAEVHVVEYSPEEPMTVEGGENNGYHHVFANVVTQWSTFALWDGASPVELRYEAPLGEHVAVLVQKPGNGAMLAGARLP